MNPGTKLGGHAIEAEIGSGGMGVVYRARDERLGRSVALKLLPQTTDGERLARFEREARILATLNHPNIAGIHTLEEADGHRFITMELVRGETLAEALARGPLPMAEALDVGRQIAQALEAAHEAGVVHRDLKPGNVMLAPDGQVKVLDFGLARIDETEPDASSHTVAATRAGIVLGTAAYMSPEQARGRALDRRTDLWSFGCVLYECLTGRQAFPGETVSDSIAKILERDPDFAALPKATPDRVVELIRRCLEKDPKQRLRDAGEARWTLEQALARRTDSGTIPVVTAPVRARGLAWPKLALLALPVLAAGALLGAWLAPRGGASPLRCLSIALPTDESVRGATFLPDGSGITVMTVPRTGADAGKAHVFFRPLDGYAFREIPGTSGLTNAFTSPDGRRALLLLPAAPGAPQKRLVAMPLDGSAPPAAFADWNDAWGALCWLQSGDAIVLDTPTSFVRLPAGGGSPSAPKPITVEGDERVSTIELPPATHPDPGKLFVNVVVYDARGWHYSVGVMDLASGKVRRLVDDGGNAVYAGGVLCFTRGRTIFAVPYDIGRDAVRGTPKPVWTGLRTNLEARPAFFRVANDGTLSYSPGGTDESRVIAIADSNAVRQTLPIDSKNFDDAPVMAPDGKRFAVPAANTRGIDELWTGSIDGRDLRRLPTDPDADCTLAFWSLDGARIAYKRLGKDAKDGIYELTLASGETRCVLRQGVSDTTFRPAGYLPDGRSLLVWRNARGRDELFRLALDGNADDRARLVPFAASASNRRFPRLSPDARAVLFLGDDSGRFEACVAPVTPAGEAGPITTLTSGGTNAGQWAPDGRTVLLNDTRNRVLAFAWPPDGRGARPALDLERLNLATWTPLGGGRFLVRPRSRDESAITSHQVVFGWLDDVKKKLRS